MRTTRSRPSIIPGVCIVAITSVDEGYNICTTTSTKRIGSSLQLHVERAIKYIKSLRKRKVVDRIAGIGQMEVEVKVKAGTFRNDIVEGENDRSRRIVCTRVRSNINNVVSGRSYQVESTYIERVTVYGAVKTERYLIRVAGSYCACNIGRNGRWHITEELSTPTIARYAHV